METPQKPYSSENLEVETTHGCEIVEDKGLENFVKPPIDEKKISAQVKFYRRHAERFPTLVTKRAANFNIVSQIKPLIELPGAVFLRTYVTSQLNADNTAIIGSLMMIAAIDEKGNILGKVEITAGQASYTMHQECCGYPPSIGQSDTTIFDLDPFLEVPKP